jgi:O-antigen/teichoic acid export membrane protein
VLLARASSLIAAILMVRLFGAEAAGEFFLFLAAGALLAVIGPLGVPEAVSRLVPVADMEGDRSGAETAFASTVRLMRIVSVGLCLGAAGLWWLGIGPAWIVPATVFATAVAWQSVAASLLRSRRRVLATEVPAGCVPLVFVGLVAFLAGRGVSVGAVAWSRVLLEVLAASVAFGAARRLFGNEAHPRPDVRRLLSVATPLWITSISWLTLQVVGVLVLGVVGGPTAVGAYVPVFRLAELAALPAAVMAPYLLPTAAALRSRGDDTGSAALYRTSRVVMVTLATPILVVMWILPTHAVVVTFGEAGVATVAAARLLAVGFAINALFGPNGIFLEAVGNLRTLAARSAVTVVVGVTANLLFVSAWGVLGAAAATVVCLTALNVVNSVLLYRTTGLRPSGLAPLAVLTTGMATGAALAYIGLARSGLFGLVATSVVVGLVAVATAGITVRHDAPRSLLRAVRGEGTA